MYSPTRMLMVGTLSTAVSLLSACGSGGSDSSIAPSLAMTQTAQVPVMVSDASTEDWATIGVNVLALALIPQGGGSPVTVFTAAGSGETINLVQLDQISDILENATIPVGSYSGATLTVGGNPGDITLATSADPEPGFAAAPSTTIAANQIQIQGATGVSGSKTVPIRVTFQSPLVVTTTAPSALNLEFDLSHPAFIVGHVPVGAGATLWAVDFDGPVRQRRIDDVRQLVLRHTYGNVTAIASDDTSLTIVKDLPAIPVLNPEVAVATDASLTIEADATNGTLFYDVDAGTSATIDSFASVATTLPSKYVRVAARYQSDGSLVATRIWASVSFNKIWLSPEGHVLHVEPPNANNSNAVLVVSDEAGRPIPVAVDSATQFFFRTPANAVADATPIGSGPAFAVQNLERGFKVHVSVIDPLAAHLTAQSVDIETAAFAGIIASADTTSLTYRRKFATAADDYTANLDYISENSANGSDSSGAAITGFKYWNFAYPTLVTSGTSAIADFVAATQDGANFGGSVGMVLAQGASFGRWGDPANATGWTAPWAVIEPSLLPRGTVTTGLVTNPNNIDTFTLSVAGGTNAATIDVSAVSGSATLVYQVDRTAGVITVSAQDVTTSAGMTALTNGLAVGAPVRVYAVPQSDGTLKADALTYFTGDAPAN